MSNDLQLFQGSVPALLQEYGAQNQVGAGLADGIAGMNLKRISIKGSRFRLIHSGTESVVLPDLSLDLVIVGSTAGINRLWYEKGFKEEEARVAPSCFSYGGVVPSDQSPNKQSNTCATCPQNEKGSANQGDGKACAYKKRIVVAPPSHFDPDYTAEPDVYAFDVNAMSIFGEGDPSKNRYSLSAYAVWLNQKRQGFPNGVPPQALVTRVNLEDTSVPTVSFGPGLNADGRLSWLEGEAMRRSFDFAAGPEVKRILDLSQQEIAAGEGAATPVAPARATQGNQPITPAAKPVTPAKPTGLDWKVFAASLPDVDPDDIELVASRGGPFTEAGSKTWNKLMRVEIPAHVLRPGATPGAAPAAAPTPAPQPKPKMSWQSFARTLDNPDEDDITTIEEAGGPGTVRGLKLWNKLFVAEIPTDTVDITNGEPVLTEKVETPAPAAPAEEPPKKPAGRAPRKNAGSSTAAAQSTTAAASPAASTAPTSPNPFGKVHAPSAPSAPAAPAGTASTPIAPEVAGKTLAGAFGAFDD